MYEDKIIQGDDWRSTYRLPELFGALERKKSDLLENLPEYLFRSTLKDTKDMAPASRAIVDHFDRISNDKLATMGAISSSVDFGTGVKKNAVSLIEGPQVETTDQLFLEHKNSEMRVKYFGPAPSTIDIRDIFPDPSATIDFDPHGEKGMRWCYERRIYTWEKFQMEFAGNEMFSIADVEPVDWSGVQSMGIVRDDTKHESEEKNQDRQKFAVLFEGWDIDYDWHCFVVNGKEIYHGANPYRHKRIPLTFYYNYKRDDSIWGISEAEIWAPFIMIKEVLVNLMIDNAKLSQQPVIAVSGDVLFDPDENQLEPGALFTLKGLNGGKIGDSIQPLTFGSSVDPALAVKNILEDLQIQVTGDDSRALFVQPNELATQTLAKQESLKRRIRKNVMYNTVHSERNSLEQRFSNVCQFMAKPYEAVDGKVKYHKIFIEDFHVNQRNMSQRPEFVPVRGYRGYFHLNEKTIDPEYIFLDVIEVVEDTVKKEQEMQAIQWWMQILFSTAQANPQLLQNTDFEMLAKQVGSRFTEMDVDAIFNSVGSIVDGQDEMDYHISQIVLGIAPVIPRDGNCTRRLRNFRLFLKTKEYALFKKSAKTLFLQTMDEIVTAIREEKARPFGVKNVQPGMGAPGPTGQQGAVQGPEQAGGGQAVLPTGQPNSEAGVVNALRGGAPPGQVPGNY